MGGRDCGKASRIANTLARGAFLADPPPYLPPPAPPLHQRRPYISASTRAFEIFTSSNVIRGLSSNVSRCSGRQNSLTILKSI